jgi:hypothetical protein
MKKRKKMIKNKGQISLVALLLAAGAAVVVLSLVPRTVTEIKLSKQEEHAAQALYAAEGGVEELLKESLVCGATKNGELGEAIYTAEVTCLGEGTSPYVFGNILEQDEGIQINFGEAPGSINLYWVRTDRQEQENGSSIETILLCNDGGNYTAVRQGLNSSGEGMANFESGTEGEVEVAGVGFSYRGSVNVALACPSGTPQALRIKSLFKETTLGIQSGDGVSLPVLEYRIYSEGKIEAENIVQSVEVTRPATVGPSSIFDYAVYSGTNL